MNWKKPLSLALSTALTLSLAAPALAAPEGFTPADGARGEAEPWYAEAQAYVTEQGIMTGTDKGFEPEAEITTATVLQALYNKVGKPDVTESNDPWYIGALTWAEEEGIFHHEGETSFADGAVNRATTLDILEAFCFENGLSSDDLMVGNENGDMMAEKVLTRAEFATVLMRLDQREPYYIMETVSIDVPETDGIPAHTIPAIVTLPAQEGAFPAVVMLHGTGSNKHEAGGGYDLAAPAMAKAGIATIRFDFMGIGDSEASYTDYCFTSANIDAKAAADYMAGLEKVDGEKLAVMGWSQGGTNALLAAAAYPETFKAVVTWAGSVTSKTDTDSFKEQYEIAKKDGYYVQEYDWREPLHVGLRWYEENISFDKLAETAKIEAPIFAIQGLNDTSVLPENAEQIVAAAKNEATRAYFIEDCDHTFNVFSGDMTAITEAINAGIGFLQDTLNGSVTGSVTAVSKYGNIGTDIPADVFAGAGYAVGDILVITIGETTVEAPFGTGYSNVDTGKAIVLTDTSANTIAAAINMGNFSSTYNAPEGAALRFQMGEKEGYLEEYTIRNIDSLRTNDREDYASDEVFANFRPVVMGGIAEGVLFRSSSPVNPELGRNTYADAFAKENGVKTIIDLADSEEEYAAYEGVADSYASTTNTVKLDMGVDFAAEDFTGKLKTGLEYMLANEGPYLVHCNEGKDRAGFVTMLLECLMGGKLDEIVDDYMLSYENYYGVEHDSDRWERIANSNVIANLLTLTGAEDKAALAKADLAAAAETYLTETVGLTAEQVTGLKDLLAGK